MEEDDDYDEDISTTMTLLCTSRRSLTTPVYIQLLLLIHDRHLL